MQFRSNVTETAQPTEENLSASGVQWCSDLYAPRCGNQSSAISARQSVLVSSMTETNKPGTRVAKLLELAQADPRRLQELERFRLTLVVMFSDIQGSTAYFEKYGDAAGLFMVHQCNDAIRRRVEKHGGTVIKTIGDGTMATFPEPKNAVEASIKIQTELNELSAARKELERIALRIGM